MIGKTIQNYRIVSELGVGAMGAVYEGVDTFVERPVAIKVLRAELARQPELIERFRSEAITLARLNHPNVALLYNFFREGEDYYMAMEFVRGQSLESIIRSSGRLQADFAARILAQTLDGLAHAHSMGVLHRDIKPANILVTRDGRVKVTDFGIARVLGSSRMTRHGRIIGTLEYIAPERIRGDESDSRSDLYAAGVVLYEMLAGKLPFTAQTDFELIKAHLELEPPVLEQICGSTASAAWDAIIHKAMAKSVEQRFQTAEEFAQALPGLESSPRTAARTASTPLGSSRLAAAPALSVSAAEPGLSTVPAAAESAPAHAPVRKSPLMMVLLAATGVMVALLVFTIVLRIRASSAAKSEIPAVQAPVQLPSTAGGTSPASQPLDIPKQANDSSGSAQPDVALPADSLSGNDSKSKAASAADRRAAALRALEGGDSKPKDSKRSKALKALDQ
jgi:eukaryotic-like serine/threonine-protein kinase